MLVSKDSTLSFGDAGMMSTDIEIWREATAYRTALQSTGPKDLAKLPARFAFVLNLFNPTYIEFLTFKSLLCLICILLETIFYLPC